MAEISFFGSVYTFARLKLKIFPDQGWEPPVFPLFPWLEKVQIFLEFPDWWEAAESCNKSEQRDGGGGGFPIKNLVTFDIFPEF